jgi:hypothetical protein
MGALKPCSACLPPDRKAFLEFFSPPKCCIAASGRNSFGLPELWWISALSKAQYRSSQEFQVRAGWGYAARGKLTDNEVRHARCALYDSADCGRLFGRV